MRVLNHDHILFPLPILEALYEYQMRVVPIYQIDIYDQEVFADNQHVTRAVSLVPSTA